MVIRASSGKEVDALVADLSSASAIKRDGAVARLTVIGQRAVERLIALSSNSKASVTARVAAFRALEGIAEPRGLPPALAAFADPDSSIAEPRTKLVGDRTNAEADAAPGVCFVF